jgi:hypothetical protein
LFDSTQFVKDLAAKWSAQYPKHAKRLKKAVRLVETNQVAPRSLDSWRVAGSKLGTEHTVKVTCGYPSCTCPFEGRCSHIWACALLTRLVSKIERLLSKMVKPRPAKRPRRNELSERCASAHQANQKAMERLPLAEVIPLRR